jgi:hypothetical protein
MESGPALQQKVLDQLHTEGTAASECKQQCETLCDSMESFFCVKVGKFKIWSSSNIAEKGYGI